MLNDVQSNSLATDISFSAKLLEETVALVQQSTRDLTVDRPDFVPTAVLLSEEDTRIAYLAYVDRAAELDLPAIPEEDFVEQLLATRAGDFFRTVVNAAGLETEYEDDLVQEDSAAFPHQGDRGSFLSSEQIINSLTVPPVVASINANADLLAMANYAQSTNHLIESDPVTLADLDPTVHANSLRALSYVQTYLR